MIVQPLAKRPPESVLEALRSSLASCRDLAFAHLVEVVVPEHSRHPDPTLFVWLLPGGVRSMRSSLNLVSEAVARSLPDDLYLDVLILNSAPELLAIVESAGEPFLVRDAGEREGALAAMDAAEEVVEPEQPRPRRRWWF
jgi:hypothetical protein